MVFPLSQGAPPVQGKKVARLSLYQAAARTETRAARAVAQTQLLLNAGTQETEHLHYLISYPVYYHTQLTHNSQWGISDGVPQSQSQVQETARSGR